MLRSLLLSLILTFSLQAAAHAQSAAVQTATDAQPRVVLMWDASDTDASRFNVYRSTTPGDYPQAPLNASPLALPGSCAALEQLIAPDSDSWRRIEEGLADEVGQHYDPCDILQLEPGMARYRRLELLANSDWLIAAALGRAYEDGQVQAGTTYHYEIREVGETGEEIGTLAQDVTVEAGVPSQLAAPAGLVAQAGESRVFLMWEPVLEAAGYHVYRSEGGGTSRRINERVVAERAQNDLDGNTLDPPRPAFLDFQRFTDAGLPTTHAVEGVDIDGPFNGETYTYEVVAVDLLGQETGSFSGSVTAVPQDLTPPGVPSGLTVTPNEALSQLELRWDVVTQNVQGQQETAGLQGYRIYRYEQPNDPASGTPIGSLIPQPGGYSASFADADPALRSDYGEVTYYYRIEAVDAAGNASARSAAVGGYLLDLTPPASPQGIAAEGLEEHIRVAWDPNGEPDLAGYQVYRSQCHYGQWVPCWERDRQNCSGPFQLIREVSRHEADSLASVASNGKPFLEDRTVPDGSPLCYAYLVKALDESENQSGNWPMPDLGEETVVCERLRDRTPPEGAVIVALEARDGGVELEWVGAPVQDIAAYHVYRSTKQDGSYRFVGGRMVQTPAQGADRLLAPFEPPQMGCCDQIPLQARDDMSEGALLDTLDVDPKQVYWYHVRGIDQSGNETLAEAPIPISTFTYSSAQPQAPATPAVTPAQNPYGLTVSWQPAFQEELHRGFAIFRSEEQDGPYRQVGALIQGNEYRDGHVAAGQTYWYRVMYIAADGRRSLLSPAQSGSIAP